MFTVLAKTYPGTGRPNTFRVVPDDAQERIDRLVQGFGFVVVELHSTIKSEDAAWDRYTYVDADGYTQWLHD